MNVTFTVPDAIATELNAIARANGFANAKAMTIFYWKSTIKAARQAAIAQAVTQANVNDVVVS